MPGETAGTVQIALLRAVMPTGKNKVPMAALRETLGALGCTDVRTLLASGNAVFRSPGPAGAELEAILERAVAEHIGPKLDVMVRDAAAWAKIAAANPFPDESVALPSRVLATVFKSPPSREAAHSFEAAATGPELARIVDDVLWAVYPGGGRRLAADPGILQAAPWTADRHGAQLEHGSQAPGRRVRDDRRRDLTRSLVDRFPPPV
jgi:uncharacterized protein (DUF1697 family)